VISEFEQYQTLLSQNGREEFTRVVRAFRDQYGNNWRKEFAAKNPDFVFIVDLIANNGFEDAFLKLKAHVAEKVRENAGDSFFKRQGLIVSANVFLEGARSELEVLHRMIRTEIDRPRI
jgi:hypothetical protein